MSRCLGLGGKNSTLPMQMALALLFCSGCLISDCCSVDVQCHCSSAGPCLDCFYSVFLGNNLSVLRKKIKVGLFIIKFSCRGAVKKVPLHPQYIFFHFKMHLLLNFCVIYINAEVSANASTEIKHSVYVQLHFAVFCLFNYYKSACKKEGNIGKFGLSLLVGVCFLSFVFFSPK